MTGKASSGSSRALGEFLSEAQEMVESLNRDVLKFDDNLRRKLRDPDLINSIFRSAHSLKGVSGMFGLQRMSDLSHEMENLLDNLRMGRIESSPQLVTLLFDFIEVLNQLIAEAGGGPKVAKKTLSDLSERIKGFAPQEVKSEQKSPLDEIELEQSVRSVLTEYEEFRLIDCVRRGVNLYKIHASFHLIDFDESLGRLSESIKALGELITTLPSSQSSSTDEIDFDLIAGSESPIEVLREKLESDTISVTAIKRKGGTVQAAPLPPAAPARPDKEPEAEKAAADESPPPRATAEAGESSSLRSISQTVRVDIGKLDNLMSIVGELVLVKTSLQSIAENLKIELGFTGPVADLQKQARNFERKLNELQNGIMEVRMVPLQQIFEKLARMVRKLAMQFEKQIELHIGGADTELDKLIIEELADPLMHILRNSVDHGIELPQERIRIGKPPAGNIDLLAYQKGNHVVIEVRDDGRGLDLEKIKQVALRKGLVPAERIPEMSRRDLYNLLFLPGFSTADKVTEISGRGVGLDVVKTNITRLSGMIDIESQSGKGTTLSITLPITLAIMRALIVKVSEQNYAIPLNSVLEILRVPVAKLHTIEKREVIELRGSTLPLVRLADVFELQKPAAQEEDNLYIVVVGLAENRLGLVVNYLLGQQDIVIQPLSRSLAKIPGIAGATSLTSQQTILVLDIGGIVEESLQRD
jgi:two-component system chemotaxis sensor kinase CheA